MKNLIYIFLAMATFGSGVLYSCKQESEGKSSSDTVSESSRDSYNDPAEEASGKEQGESSSKGQNVEGDADSTAVGSARLQKE